MSGCTIRFSSFFCLGCLCQSKYWKSPNVRSVEWMSKYSIIQKPSIVAPPDYCRRKKNITSASKKSLQSGPRRAAQSVEDQCRKQDVSNASDIHQDSKVSSECIATSSVTSATFRKHGTTSTGANILPFFLLGCH